jgi:hypothetical protein
MQANDAQDLHWDNSRHPHSHPTRIHIEVPGYVLAAKEFFYRRGTRSATDSGIAFANTHHVLRTNSSRILCNI